MMTIIATVLTAILIGPGSVNAAQCTSSNDRCFRGQFIVQFNYGSLAAINTNNIPYVHGQFSFKLINTERTAPNQQFIQAGYTVGGCDNATPMVFGEFYNGTAYDSFCLLAADGGYNAYYMQRNPDGGWCIGYNQSPGLFCKTYPNETPISAGSAVTAYGETTDSTIVMGGNSTTISPTGYIASIQYNSNTSSNFVPITSLGGQYATCGASPCPYAENAYFQGGYVNVAVAGP